MGNCDLNDIKKERFSNGKKLYGKKMLISHRPYGLWNEEDDKFDLDKIVRFYKYFIANMKAISEVFETKWVHTNQLLPATKGIAWDWTSEEEQERNIKDVYENGFYFPILTLDKGLFHNQVGYTDEELRVLSSEGLYNSYNGNHRMDVAQTLVERGLWCKDKEILIFIIPPFCQKSCTGFKYDLIDLRKEHPLTKWKLRKNIELIHLDLVEHEMKVIDWPVKKYIEKGVSKVLVDSYNVAFRVMLEIQNVLEPVLVRYYKLYGELPSDIRKLNKGFNERHIWEKHFKSINLTQEEKAEFNKNIDIKYKRGEEIGQNCIYQLNKMCSAKDKYNKECKKSLCCGFCSSLNFCNHVCDLFLNHLNNS